MRAVFTVSLLLLATTAFGGAIHGDSILHLSCEDGWSWNQEDDTCNKVFPRLNRRNNTGEGDAVAVTYWDAQSYCAGYGGVVPAIQNHTGQLKWLMNLVRTETSPGSSWWIGVHADRSFKRQGVNHQQHWITPTKRTTGFTFRWDASRHQPSYEGCVVMHMIGDRDHVGGNDKMITVDCEERHHTVCTKPRVPTMITAIENTVPTGSLPKKIEISWGYERTVTFAGAYIPQGMRVSLQTTDAGDTEKPKRRTHCKNLHTLAGASEPFLLNVSSGPQFNSSELCGTPKARGGPCYTASFRIPASWPLIRGAQYSFCFFNPRPFAVPEVYPEWENEYIHHSYLEVVQKDTDYLRDLCNRRAANVNLFYGDRRTDINRDKVTPWYFNSKVEEGFPGHKSG